ncbi:hypothetical protein [Aquamicrobium sp.]|uniref:hypothetical protein n=1 Tax=Aquamicrobium sp. TaxID=1872579 RepID=UPI002590C215|nr:hypothetical protein [Aquamicrobium sp.]MCK9549658.1 hypothetical protein [Aquamicrobium sp.]
MPQSEHKYNLLRGQLEKLLERLPESSEHHRSALYDRMRQFMADKHPNHLSLLEQVIAETEARYANLSLQNAGIATETGGNEFLRNKPSDSTVMIPKKRSGAPVIVIAGIAALIGVAAGWFYLSSTPDMLSSSFARKTDSLRFSMDAVNLQPITNEAAAYQIVEVDGARLIQATGPLQLYQIDSVEIDPAKTYRVTVRLRVTRDDPEIGGARTYAGVATYDADGKLQNTAPGSHRYAALTNRIISEREGWVEAEGLITGVGNESHNQFRQGTVAVRPMVLLNYQSSAAVSLLDYVRFEEVRSE